MSAAIEPAPHVVTTHNHATDSENRMHSDEVAQQFGFAGALVPGVTVFAHMTYPLVQAFGERWLGRATGEVRLLKPAYDGDRLSIHTQADGDGHVVDCRNDAGVLLARLTTSMPARNLPPDPRWRTTPARVNPPRAEIAEHNIQVDAALAAHAETISADANQALARSLTDDLPIWHKPANDILATPLHPLWLASSCNQAFMRVWQMPSWIHAGTVFTLHRPLRIAERIEQRTIPIRKWAHKGHEFATLYLAWLVDGEIAAEAQHTAIYKIATPPERKPTGSIERAL